MQDKQITAFQKIVETLGDLDDADRRAVLGYVSIRYKDSPLLVPTPTGVGAETTGPTTGAGAGAAVTSFASFPDLYHAANPETESDKALVGGYWLQACQKQDSFDSFNVNKCLKDMGYNVSNITRAIDTLMAQEPKYVQQVKKSGTSRQARKLFKVTQAGVKRVAEMLSHAPQ